MSREYIVDCNIRLFRCWWIRIKMRRHLAVHNLVSQVEVQNQMYQLDHILHHIPLPQGYDRSYYLNTSPSSDQPQKSPPNNMSPPHSWIPLSIPSTQLSYSTSTHISSIHPPTTHQHPQISPHNHNPQPQPINLAPPTPTPPTSNDTNASIFSKRQKFSIHPSNYRFYIILVHIIYTYYLLPLLSFACYMAFGDIHR
jgi:hypothetical protein